MADQYGVVLALSKVEDAAATEAELRSIAGEWVEFSGLRPLSEITIIRHADVSELDWQMMQMRAPWRPGYEVWGWKLQAEKK